MSLPCLSIIRQSREKAAPQIENEHDRKWIESSDQLHIIVLFLPQQHNTHGCTRLRSVLSSFIAAAALYRLVARTPNERRTREKNRGDGIKIHIPIGRNRTLNDWSTRSERRSAHTKMLFFNTSAAHTQSRYERRRKTRKKEHTENIEKRLSEQHKKPVYTNERCSSRYEASKERRREKGVNQSKISNNFFSNRRERESESFARAS